MGIILFACTSDLGDSSGHTFINGELYILKRYLYHFISNCYIVRILLCKNKNTSKVK
jgi:hypothetical protein